MMIRIIMIISHGLSKKEKKTFEVMTNSSPWKDPPFLIAKPWENHGKMVIYMERSTIL